MAQSLKIPVEINLKTKSVDFDKVAGKLKNLKSTISGAVGSIKNKFNDLNSTLAQGFNLDAISELGKKCLELSSNLVEV